MSLYLRVLNLLIGLDRLNLHYPNPNTNYKFTVNYGRKTFVKIQVYKNCRLLVIQITLNNKYNNNQIFYGDIYKFYHIKY